MRTLATILDGLVIFVAFWAAVALFTMSSGVVTFIDMAAYVALWLAIPALIAAAAHRIVQRASAE